MMRVWRNLGSLIDVNKVVCLDGVLPAEDETPENWLLRMKGCGFLKGCAEEGEVFVYPPR
jgi:hypothetical protein